jgi:diamine N-acetyltransferase
MALKLVPVTRDNLRAVCALDAGDGGRQVAPNVMSMAQAAVHGEAWPRAIEVDGELVGFLMLYDPSLVSEPHEPDYYLWRLMIDREHHGRGYGRAAVLELIEHVTKRPGATRLLVSYMPPADHLARFYASFGFVPTGEVDDGEIVLALPLR